MIPITALLNDSDEHEQTQRFVPVEEAPGARGSIRDHAACMAPPAYPSTYAHSPRDGAARSIQRRRLNSSSNTQDAPRDSLTESSSSLLGALSLQALRYSCPPSDVTPSARPDRSASALQAEISPRTPTTQRHASRSLYANPADEDRRAKQRMIVKRCYYKKIDTINDLREQVQRLEHAFHVLLEYEMQRRAAEAEQGAAQTVQQDPMRRRWVEMLMDKEALRHENQRLRKLADEHYMKNQSRLRVLLDANRKEINLFTPAVRD